MVSVRWHDLNEGVERGYVDQNVLVLFFFLYFLFWYLTCACTLDSQSFVKENKLNIFKVQEKKWKKYYIV